MKLVTFQVQTRVGRFRRLGALSERGIIDLNAAYATYLNRRSDQPRASAIASALMPTDMIDFFRGGESSRQAAEIAVEFVANRDPEGSSLRGPNGEQIVYQDNQVRILAPLPRPNTIRDYTGFRQHMEVFLREIGLPDVTADIFRSRPMYFKGNPEVVYGPEDEIPWPSYSEKLDYEIEPAIIIGRAGINIPVEEAHNYIAGYTILNDISARDYQKDEMGLPINLYGVSKSKDCGYVLGPCVVTPDELAFDNLDLIVRVNGEERSRGNTSDMDWSFADIISYSSLDEPVFPGDCMAGGTPPHGSGSEIGRWIEEGDVVECEIEGIGVLRNRIGGKRS